MRGDVARGQGCGAFGLRSRADGVCREAVVVGPEAVAWLPKHWNVDDHREGFSSMSGRVFEVLQQMLKLRKDRSVAQSKLVKAEYERVRAFKDQIESYANEYESQWMVAAQQGDTVLQLQTQANFGQNLRATAKSQQPEVTALKSQSREALDKALHDAQRLKTMQNFLANRQRKQLLARGVQEEKVLEDVLQARYRGR